MQSAIAQAAYSTPPRTAYNVRIAPSVETSDLEQVHRIVLVKGQGCSTSYVSPRNVGVESSTSSQKNWFPMLAPSSTLNELAPSCGTRRRTARLCGSLCSATCSLRCALRYCPNKSSCFLRQSAAPAVRLSDATAAAISALVRVIRGATRHARA